MSHIRLIARLDIKAPNLIKSINLEGVRVIGDPQVHAERYYLEGADELVYMDMVASLYGRNHLREIVERTANNVFIPMTVGGGIRSIEDVEDLLRSGADKVAVNTAAVADPDLLTRIARRFGSQCLVLSIEAKRLNESAWEPYTDCGRERSFRDAVEWAREGADRGAGEILVTSIDREGTGTGFDVALTRRIADAVPLPVIASGGMGKSEHVTAIVVEGHADAVAMADVLHYGKLGLPEIRESALAAGLDVRRL